MTNHTLQKRIGWQGDLRLLLRQVCNDYKIGKYADHVLIQTGYEDFNLRLSTGQGLYFVKIFATSRNLPNCKRIVKIMERAVEAGVQYPKLYKSSQGYLYQTVMDSVAIRLCVMQHIGGKDLFQLRAKATKDEARFLIQQAALINNITLKPTPLYDSWAIKNILVEYERSKPHLNADDDKLLQPVVKKCAFFDPHKLPHCFVHGDIIATNVMRSVDGKLYILDFSASNYYPRIVELAVMFSDLLFDHDDETSFPKNYDLALSEYQKYIPLAPNEIAALPLYIQGAHAMHVIRGTYEKVVMKNSTAENEYHLNMGRIGLRYTSKLWSN